MAALYFYGSLFGLSLMNGDTNSRQVFLAVVLYLVKVISKMCEIIMTCVNSINKFDSYEDVIYIYRSAAYNTLSNFITFPELYKICGFLIFVYGSYKFLVYGRQKN